MIRVDLHTHSTSSPDGGLTLKDYRRALSSSLDVIAVTDHNTVSGALKIKGELGTAIIVGEEVSTKQGEIIGLYLTEDIPLGLDAIETAKRIKQQGGLVYVPHPYERVQRHGLNPSTLKTLLPFIDIVETFNGRTISAVARGRAKRFAHTNKLAVAASSDAHGPAGLGSVKTVINKMPNSDTLIGLLKTGKVSTRVRKPAAYLEPSKNRRQKKHQPNVNNADGRAI